MVSIELCRTSEASAEAFQRYLTGKTGFNLQVRVYKPDIMPPLFPNMSHAVVIETDRSDSPGDIQEVLNMIFVDFVATTPAACPRCGTATEMEPLIQ